MSNAIVLRPTPSNRRQPLLVSKSGSGSVRFAEVAGGTTAECAAVCCCCPCAIVNFLVLAIYKVPAGLCRRALRMKRRQKLRKKGLIPPRRGRYSIGFDETDVRMFSAGRTTNSLEIKSSASVEAERKVVELEKEMWEIFYGTGFWRSPSQREQIPSSSNGKSLHSN